MSWSINVQCKSGIFDVTIFFEWTKPLFFSPDVTVTMNLEYSRLRDIPKTFQMSRVMFLEAYGFPNFSLIAEQYRRYSFCSVFPLPCSFSSMPAWYIHSHDVFILLCFWKTSLLAFMDQFKTLSLALFSFFGHNFYVVLSS